MGTIWEKTRIKTMEEFDAEIKRTNSIYVVDKHISTEWIERWKYKTKEKYLAKGVYYTENITN